MDYKSPKKRKMEEDDDDIGKVYKFKILLPNSTSVELTLRDPDPEMPFGDFIGLVRDKYFEARTHSESLSQKRSINWKGGSLFLQDANDMKIRYTVKFKNYKPQKWHTLLLIDGSSDIPITNFENMWDLTPDTDLLCELLAELIDNSLQAVWSNKEEERRLIRVNLDDSMISIFDTGPGMDDSDENSLLNWGKMGASLRRTLKSQGIGGKPPYLLPCFGMFGCGGPIASMYLGRRALVSSKTKESKKVYMLHLSREAWKTNSGIRDPSEDEIRDSRHGSFTKVQVLHPKVKGLDMYKLQCHLKDIYFPYIQCDDMSGSQKTTTLIEFQVNGVDLAEIEGGEVAVTNLNSCNGPDFVLQLHFSLTHHHGGIKTPGSGASQVANASLKCVYIPCKEGTENIGKVLEKLKADGCEIKETFESFNRVSIRWLGRLLPGARWSLLPFMESKHKRGSTADLMKRCCMRVKCSIETDAGFNPTSSKTDLAHDNLFTTALKNLGSKFPEQVKDVVVEISKDGKLLTPLQLEREYQEWIFQMHELYDEEAESGEDQPVIIVSPTNKKALGISSNVIRVHTRLKRKGESWERGQKIKVLKGACAGCHKNNIYATIEYFLLEGFEGDTGGEARIICRPIDVPDDNGCVLSVGDNKDATLDIRGSLSLPLRVIDIEKLEAIDGIEWKYQLDKKQQKSPVAIELLNSNHCQQLELDGALPIAPVQAGQVPPSQVVAIVRQANFISGATDILDPKYVIKRNIDMYMEVKFKDESQGIQDTIHRTHVSPLADEKLNGFYIFPLGSKFPDIFHKAGVYIFSFSIMETSCKTCVKKVTVRPSDSVGRWGHLTDDKTPLTVKVGSAYPTLAIASYDIYENRMPFAKIPEVSVKFHAAKGLLIKVVKMKTSLSTNRLTLYIKDVLVESTELDKIKPGYGVTLIIAPCYGNVSVSIPCRVYPGSLHRVVVQPPISENQLLPGYVFKDLVLEMFDAYGNHVSKGLEVTLSVVGFTLHNQVVMVSKVDDDGKIDLSGLLRVVAGHGEKASFSVLFEGELIFNQAFLTLRRKLRIASQVPDVCAAGNQLENIVFEISDPDGAIDKTINHNDKDGQSHMLKIKSESFQAEESIQYTFKHGQCCIPSIPLPLNEGLFCFQAAHSRYPELCLTVKVSLVKALEVNYDSSHIPYSDDGILLMHDSPSFEQEKNLMISFIDNEKGLADEVARVGQNIGKIEEYLGTLNNQKDETEQEMFKLQEKVNPYLLSNLSRLSTKELHKRIENMENSAASVLCSLSTYQMQQKSFMEDIFGVVALLGSVGSPMLSRVLAEFLGEEKMLAVICRSFDAASTLERYKQNGEVDSTFALHAEATALAKALNRRFLVICLEDIRPYNGGCQENDPQRKLALPYPTLSDGTIPSGFIGYAVNMIDLHVDHLNMRTTSGFGLRETVLFSLFRKLHVYETRESMVAARACIEDGAVSLDGGILGENGTVSLGYGDPFIYFPSESQMVPPQEAGLVMAQVEEKKSLLRNIEENIEYWTKRHKKHLKKFHRTKGKYQKLLDGMKHVMKVDMLEYKPNTSSGDLVDLTA